MKSVMKIHVRILILAAFTSVLFQNSWAAPLTDECESIRERISQVPPVGGEVLISEGTYTCMSPIILNKNNLILRGQGRVVLRLGDRVNAPVVVMGDVLTPPQPLHGIEVINLAIDGNRWAQKYECWGGPCDTGGTSYIRNNGITVRGLSDGKIKDVTITGARSGGVVTERGCYDLDIDGLVATDNEFDGFAGYETFGARIMNTTLVRNRAAGISLDIRFHGNFFKNIRIEDNGDVGIFMRDSNMNIFEDVTILNSGSHGIFLAQADGPATCSYNNEFTNLTVNRSRGWGFRLNDACEGNRFSGTAQFFQNRDGCLSEASGARLDVQGQMVCKE